MKTETKDLFEKLIDISKNITVLTNMQKVLVDPDTIEDSILIIDSKTNIINHKMNAFLNLKYHPKMIKALKIEIDGSLYTLMNLYAEYEKALQMSYPNVYLYEAINEYIACINNNRALENMKITLDSSQKYNLYIKASINNITEGYNKTSTSQDFRFNNDLAFIPFNNCLESLIDTTDLLLDGFAQAIITNYNKMLEEKVEEPADTTKNIEIKMPMTELDDLENTEEVTEIHPLIEDEGNKE